MLSLSLNVLHEKEKWHKIFEYHYFQTEFSVIDYCPLGIYYADFGLKIVRFKYFIRFLPPQMSSNIILKHNAMTFFCFVFRLSRKNYF